ncbi:MAG: tRNA (N(6)-L-threonylcarbamoyladenosine(37)-C(2))-methylthiotransferase MtaB [Planctomycetaceae bacterium]|jgi:threonylcarbamoyladenosine tRNA methylthiotransferase MtaB|nr:tRNA (N(6)-L-threonylcarbamoyladenosine(37)-C(2))-methylthiotransferase MtaB [Planctomycetaceae bacterium]
MFFRLATLGCKVNQYETELVRSALLQSGFIEAENGMSADLVIVNTCTVTAESDAKSRKIIRKLIKENPGAKVAVMGCSVTHQPDAVLKIGGVSHILTDKSKLPDFLQQLNIRSVPAGITSFGGRHRAFLKIQDGCNNGCAYCIIPKVRPVRQSRRMDDVLAEMQALVRTGYREIVLTGIHLGYYGVDMSGRTAETTNLTELVRRAADLPEEFRLRFSSIEAVEVSDDLIDLMLRYPDRICHHLHLPMQSGSSSVLQRMNRRWLCEPFVNRCEEILARFDRLALTTDIITGFPGETDEEFQETVDAVQRLRFSKVHIFRYSKRSGTAAAAMPNPVPPKEQKRRSAYLADIAGSLRCQYAASLIGMKETVLCETAVGHAAGGTCSRYMDVRFDLPQPMSGHLVPIYIESVDGDICRGKVCGTPPSHSFASL